ncbi:MAG: DUF4347 domain-containing protein [Microcoleus sp. SIO2G3]|nr:DUF4347 domain-containing protein [Microcoleus sp. SIO2G3]
MTLGAPSRTRLIFIDAAVNDYLSLIAAAKPGTEVILLAPGEDGVAQISAFLAEHTNIASVHIVSHGSPGSLQLGNTHLSIDTLEQYRSQLQQWQNALSADAELLLYGCNVAAGERGITFIENLKSLVGVEIAASNNLTGSAAQGGDWDLAMTTGTVEAELAFEPEAIATYAWVLEDGEVLLEEDFSDASGATPPPGWTNVVLAGNPATDQWRFDNPGNRTFLNNLLESPFAVYDSDALSDDNIAESIAFVSPVFDASDETGVFLQFDQVYEGIQGGEFASEAFVEASTDGVNWQEVYSSNLDGTLINTPTVDLTDALAGAETAQIRFRFDGNWSYLWAIDNVEVVDFLPAGVTLPTGFIGVSEDNVPDPLDFQFALQSRPTSDVTFSFTVDETQLEAIAPITFTPDNWFDPQVSVVEAVADGIAEGNEQVSNVSITITSEDPNYNGLVLEDIPVQITDNAIPGYTSYRTVEETYSDLSALAEANPDIASWVDIGDSYDKVTPGGSEGYDIYALQLTNQSTNGSEPKPVFYVQSAIHAREYSTTEAVTRFAEDLITSYGVDADTTWLLDNFQVHVVPILNPDGRKFAEQGYSWRKNTNPGDNSAPFPTYGVDLNRNYDFLFGQVPGGSSGDPSDLTYRGPFAFSEPESQAARDYLYNILPDQNGATDFGEPAPEQVTGLYFDVHSYGDLILAPYGVASLVPQNLKELETLGRKFGYYTGVDGEAYDVGPGYGLYDTDGTTNDWVYQEFGLPAYTLELGTAFFEDTEYFENTIVPEILPTLFYAAKSAYRPYVTAQGPETLEVTADLGQVVAGTSSVVLSAIADDTRYDDGVVNDLDSGAEPVQNIATARYSIDAPSWVSGTETYELTAADGTFDSTVETLTATIDTSGLSAGRHTIFVESQDADGNFGVPTAVFLDVIDAPEGANVLDGNSGGETLVGTNDADVVYGRDGDDTVAGELGDDILFGNGGDDVMRGDANSREPGGSEGGDDIIYGGDGNDRIGGKGGDDKLYGEAGDDFIWGDDGDDLIWGGLGNDTLVGDNFSGGNGSDTFVLAVGEGTDTISDFQLGEDFIGLTTGLAFDLLSITQNGSDTFIDYNDETLALLAGVQANDLISSAATTFTII